MNGLRTNNPLSDSSSAANRSLAEREARLRQELEKAGEQQARGQAGDGDQEERPKADALAAAAAAKQRELLKVQVSFDCHDCLPHGWGGGWGGT